MPTIHERRLKLREIMKQPGAVVAPSGFDALSASLIETIGFAAIHAAGSSISRFHGYQDMGLLGMTEMVTVQEQMVEATTVPIVGDAETAFGGPLHTARTVGAFERAGLAAIHIEDDLTPKSPGGGGGQHSVIPVPEMVEKLKSALDARTDAEFVIIARTNSRSCESIDQVIERISAYAQAGVDAIWPGVRIKEELQQVARFVQLPMVGVLPRPEISVKAYGEYGFKVACIPAILGQASTLAMGELLENFKNTESDEEYWKQHPTAQRWKQWYTNFGKAK